MLMMCNPTKLHFYARFRDMRPAAVFQSRVLRYAQLRRRYLRRTSFMRFQRHGQRRGHLAARRREFFRWSLSQRASQYFRRRFSRRRRLLNRLSRTPRRRLWVSGLFYRFLIPPFRRRQRLLPVVRNVIRAQSAFAAKRVIYFRLRMKSWSQQRRQRLDLFRHPALFNPVFRSAVRRRSLTLRGAATASVWRIGAILHTRQRRLETVLRRRRFEQLHYIRAKNVRNVIFHTTLARFTSQMRSNFDYWWEVLTKAAQSAKPFSASVIPSRLTIPYLRFLPTSALLLARNGAFGSSYSLASLITLPSLSSLLASVQDRGLSRYRATNSRSLYYLYRYLRGFSLERGGAFKAADRQFLRQEKRGRRFKHLGRTQSPLPRLFNRRFKFLSRSPRFYHFVSHFLLNRRRSDYSVHFISSLGATWMRLLGAWSRKFAVRPFYRASDRALLESRTRFSLIRRLLLGGYYRYEFLGRRFFYKRGTLTSAEKFIPLVKHLFARGAYCRLHLARNQPLVQRNVYKYTRRIVIKSRGRNTWLTVINPDGTTAFGKSFGSLGFNTKKSRKSLKLAIQAMFERFRIWFHHDFSNITGYHYELKFTTPTLTARGRSYMKFWINKMFAYGRNPTITGQLALRQTRFNRLRSLLNFNQLLLTSRVETVAATLPLLLSLPLLLRLRYFPFRPVTSTHCFSLTRLAAALWVHPVVRHRFALLASNPQVHELLLLRRPLLFRCLLLFRDTRQILTQYLDLMPNYLLPLNLKRLKRLLVSYATMTRRPHVRADFVRQYSRSRHHLHRLYQYSCGARYLSHYNRRVTRSEPYANVALRVVRVRFYSGKNPGVHIKMKKARRK